MARLPYMSIVRRFGSAPQFAAAALLFVLLSAGAAHAASQWNIAGGGSWNNPANWNPAGVPGAGATVTFPATFTGGVITLDSNPNINSLTFNGTGAGEQQYYQRPDDIDCRADMDH
jgi:hypothetical protein